jgi:fumarylacetoacetate (FAA) hydrolase
MVPPIPITAMKLASFNDGSRDGHLMVVSRDLRHVQFATGVASRMQQLLDDWNFLSPQLEELYRALNAGKARHAMPFDARACMAPLPRAVQWADGSSYLNHVALLRRARGADLPASLRSEPLMVQGGSDHLLGPHDEARFGTVAWGIDFAAEIAVVTGDVRIGARADQALDSVRLLMLVNDWTLRELVTSEGAKGFGFLQSKPATAFSPLAVTPDELGEAWHDGRVHLRLDTHWNGRSVGRCDAGPEMAFHFGQLIAHLAKTRNVSAGSIIGSGTVSNPDRTHGYSCIAEQRALETIDHGAPTTDYMQFGDVVRIEMMGLDGQSVFGAIEQRVGPLEGA